MNSTLYWVGLTLVSVSLLEFFVMTVFRRTPSGLLLPGWFCPSCRAFNGAAKEHLTYCRCCNQEAP
jgi:hypothetical protein